MKSATQPTTISAPSSWSIRLPEIKIPTHIDPTTRLALSILATVGAYFLSPPPCFFVTAAGSVLINFPDAYHICDRFYKSAWPRVNSQTQELASP
ncbi:MAG: hypothetical protein EB127_19400, partial [Alphaproteobacteria bacterium]|nr:hypothetical protein [Alphaproteobacteria bacterium]